MRKAETETDREKAVRQESSNATFQHTEHCTAYIVFVSKLIIVGRNKCTIIVCAEKRAYTKQQAV